MATETKTKKEPKAGKLRFEIPLVRILLNSDFIIPNPVLNIISRYLDMQSGFGIKIEILKKAVELRKLKIVLAETIYEAVESEFSKDAYDLDWTRSLQAPEGTVSEVCDQIMALVGPVVEYQGLTSTFLEVTPMLTELDGGVDDWGSFSENALKWFSDGVAVAEKCVSGFRSEISPKYVMGPSEAGLADCGFIVMTSEKSECRCRMPSRGINRLMGGYASGDKEVIKPGMLYLFCGCPGQWKSCLLLNFAYGIAEATEFKSISDRGLIPVVLYVSLENTDEQTLLRLCSYYDYKDVESFDFGEKDLKVARKRILNFRKHLSNQLSSNNGPAEVWTFEEKQDSMSVRNLEQIIQNMDSSKYKPVACVIDYPQVMAANPSQLMDGTPTLKADIHMKRADTFKRLKIMATTYGLPVIAAWQFLKSSVAKIMSEINLEANAAAILNSMTMGDLSGSNEIIQTCDLIYGIIPLHQTYESPEISALGIQVLKGRVKRAADRTVIPVIRSIRLPNDVDGTERMYKTPEMPIVTKASTEVFGNTTPAAVSSKKKGGRLDPTEALKKTRTLLE